VVEGWNRIAFVSVGPFHATWRFDDQPTLETRDRIPVRVTAVVEWQVDENERSIREFAANPDHELSLVRNDAHEKFMEVLGAFDDNQISSTKVLEKVRIALESRVARAISVVSVKSIEIESSNATIKEAPVKQRVRTIEGEAELAEASHKAKVAQTEIELQATTERALVEDQRRKAELSRAIRVEDANALLNILATPQGLSALFPDQAVVRDLELRKLEIELAKVTAMVDSEVIRTKEELFKKSMDAIVSVMAPAAKADVLERVLGSLRILDHNISDQNRGGTPRSNGE
jgi:hypothetical protein